MNRKTTPPNPAAVSTLTPSDLLRMSDYDYDAARTAARTGNVAPVVLNRIEYAAVARLEFSISQYTHLLRYRNVAGRVARYMNAAFDAWVSMWTIDDVVVYEDITPTPTPTPADVARCAPAILTAMLSQPVTPTPTMYATLVSGRVSYCYPEVLTTTSYATVEDWVAGEGVRNHPDTTWVIRIIKTSVDVGTYVAYVDGRGDVLTMHASTVNVAEMVRYYAGGMVDDLGSTLDTCYTAYDVVAAVCNRLVATGNEAFYIDGEMVAMMMYTGDYHTPLTNQDIGAYAELWYKSYDAVMSDVVAAVCNHLVATGVDVYSMGASVVAGGLSMAYDEIEYYFEHWYNDEGHTLNFDATGN